MFSLRELQCSLQFYKLAVVICLLLSSIQQRQKPTNVFTFVCRLLVPPLPLIFLSNCVKVESQSKKMPLLHLFQVCHDKANNESGLQINLTVFLVELSHHLLRENTQRLSQHTSLFWTRSQNIKQNLYSDMTSKLLQAVSFLNSCFFCRGS